MKRFPLLIFMLLTVGSLYAAEPFQVIYQQKKYENIARFFENDLMLVLPSTRNIELRYQSGFPFRHSLKRLKETQNFQEAFFVYRDRKWIGVRYVNLEKMRQVFVRFVVGRRDRRISIISIRKAFGINVPLVKKQIALLPMKNLSGSKQYDFIEEMLPTSIGNALLSSERVKVRFAFLEKNLKKEFQGQSGVWKEDAAKVLRKTGSHAGVLGNYIVQKNKIRATVWIFKDQKIVSSIQKEMPLTQELFYDIDRIAQRINGEILKQFPPEPPEVITIRKEVKVPVVREKEPEKKEPKEEKKEVEKKAPEKKPEGLVRGRKTPVFEGLKVPEVGDAKPMAPEKRYATAGIVEIGGAVWGDFKGWKSGEVTQQLWVNQFFYVFPTDLWQLGIKGELEYNLDTSQYAGSAYLVNGLVFRIGGPVYGGVTLNMGYTKNDFLNKNLISYGNELLLKFRLAPNFLMGVGGGYYFYTDLNQNYFNDKIRGFISFSGYF